jgi:hypothetical protein
MLLTITPDEIIDGNHLRSRAPASRMRASTSDRHISPSKINSETQTLHGHFHAPIIRASPILSITAP